MKAAFLSLAVAAGLALSSGTASAQYRSFGGHGHGGHGHGHGHGHSRGYTEYHPGYWHGNHYHPGHLHTYSRPPVVYSQPLVTPYNAGLYGASPYSGFAQPGLSFGFNYNSGYRGFGGRRW
jgi:hypothetical protein